MSPGSRTPKVEAVDKQTPEVSTGFSSGQSEGTPGKYGPLPKFDDRLQFWQTRIVEAEDEAGRVKRHRDRVKRDKHVNEMKRNLRKQEHSEFQLEHDTREQIIILQESLKPSRWDSFKARLRRTRE
ncbi:MAG: uncharacterized protein KVP18_003121 [Porospora cf. gigantea A]|uniref:uncharacterized protein n=1 Tax=Porospora cf. gigantea A TaxID=2853593 RepID=UPI00355A67E4|nr:MAG: hypothetical protein KVP18_003121 [Porospora cf. gigantea A]